MKKIIYLIISMAILLLAFWWALQLTKENMIFNWQLEEEETEGL